MLGQETCLFIRALLIAICVTLSKLCKESELFYSCKIIRILCIFCYTSMCLIYFVILFNIVPHLIIKTKDLPYVPSEHKHGLAFQFYLKS